MSNNIQSRRYQQNASARDQIIAKRSATLPRGTNNSNTTSGLFNVTPNIGEQNIINNRLYPAPNFPRINCTNTSDPTIKSQCSTNYGLVSIALIGVLVPIIALVVYTCKNKPRGAGATPLLV